MKFRLKHRRVDCGSPIPADDTESDWWWSGCAIGFVLGVLIGWLIWG